MRHEGVAAIEGNVEPFVPVGGPGIGLFHALDQVLVSRARGRPETESAVDVNPGAVAFRDRNQSAKIVERAGVDVARLQDDDRRGLMAQRVLERVGLPAIQRGDMRAAHAQQTKSALDRAVPLVAGQNADLGRAVKTPLLHIPALPLQKRVTSRGEARKIRHLAATDESEAGSLSQAPAVSSTTAA